MARDLARAGADVLLVEARGRVGGRVESEVLDDGRTVQLGGEIVGEVHHAYLGLVAELGLTLVPSYVAEPGEPGFDLIGGVEIGEAWLGPDHVASLARLEAELVRLARDVDPDDPWSHPDAVRLDRMSRGDLARQVGCTPTAFRRMATQMASAAAGSLERTSLLGELRMIAAAGGRLPSDYAAWEALKVEGGSSVLVDTLEAELAGRIRYDAPVAAIDIGRPCVVTLQAVSRSAERRRQLRTRRPSPGDRDLGRFRARLQSLRRQRQLRAAKAVIALDEPVWRRVECNGLIESEHETGGFWVQGENTLSSLHGPEHIGYLEAAPEAVATATCSPRSTRRRACHAGRDAVAALGHGSVHARLHHALGAGRPDGRRPAARARTSRRSTWPGPTSGRRLHGGCGRHRSRRGPRRVRRRADPALPGRRYLICGKRDTG